MLLVKEILIKRDADAIYDYLSEPKNFVGLQPLVIEVGGFQQGSNEAGQVYVDYYAVEQLHFLGIIPYKNKIVSRMTLLEPKRRIRQEVKAALGVRLQQDISLSSNGEGTYVHNAIEYEAPVWLRSYVHQQIDSAHGFLVEELKRRMEKEVQS